MLINYEPRNKAIWHGDCSNHFGGVMRAVKHEEKQSLMECLHCGKKGYYPVGHSGEIIVNEVEI